MFGRVSGRLIGRNLIIMTIIQQLIPKPPKKTRIQLELETPLGKALIEDNSYSIVEINIDV